MNPWVFPLLLIGGLLMYTGLHALKNSRERGSRVFFFLMATLSAWSILYAFMFVYMACFWGMDVPVSEIDRKTIWITEAYFYPIALVGPLFLHTTLEITGFMTQRVRKWSVPVIYLFPLVDIVLITYSLATGQQWLHLYKGIENGYLVTEHGPLFTYFHMPYNYAMIIGAWTIQGWRAAHPRFEQERNQMYLMVAGSAMGLLGNIITIGRLGPGINTPTEIDYTLLGFVGMALVYYYAIEKYGLFWITPQKEELSDEEQQFDLTVGHVFHVNDSDMAFEIFSDMVHHGTRGIAVTTQEPSEIRPRYDLKKTTVIKIGGRWKNMTIDPSNSEVRKMMFYILRYFLAQERDSIILLDGFEIFIRDDEAEKYVVESLRNLIDYMEEKRTGRLLLCISDEFAERHREDILKDSLEL